MEKSIEIETLKDRINTLEAQNHLEYLLLKDELNGTVNNPKPSNLIKYELHEISASPKIINNLLSNTLGLAIGYVSKKALLGKTANPIKQALGLFLQFAIASVVVKNAEAIKATGTYIINRIFRKKNDE